MQNLSEFFAKRRTKVGLVMIGAGALATLGFVWAQPSFQPLNTNRSTSNSTASVSTGGDAVTFAEASVGDSDVSASSDEPVMAEASATAGNASAAVDSSESGTETNDTSVSTSSSETTSLSVEASTDDTGDDVSIKVNGKEVPIADAASGDVRVNVRNEGTLDGSKNES